MKEHTRKPYCLITGASSGLGYELAHLYAEHHSHIILVARNKDNLERLSKDLISHYGVTTLVLPIDLEKAGAVDQIIHRISEEKLTVTTLINNAGFGLFGTFDAQPLTDIQRMIHLNCQSLVTLTWHFASEMRHRGSGRILNIASTAAFQPLPYLAVYAASKAFVLAFSDALHEELKEAGIQVSTLCPGPFQSNFASTAGMQKSLMFKKAIPDSQWIAKYAFKQFNKNKRLIVPGWSNKTLAVASQLLPGSLVSNAVGFVMRKEL